MHKDGQPDFRGKAKGKGKLRLRSAVAPPGSWALTTDVGDNPIDSDPSTDTVPDKSAVCASPQAVPVPVTECDRDECDNTARRKVCFGYIPQRRDVIPRTREQIVSNVIAGLVNGCMESVVCVTFAGMIFNNMDRNLEALLPLGASLMLYSTCVGLFWNGLFGRLPYSLCTSARGISTVVLARESVEIAEALRGAPEKVGPTIACFMAATTAVLGFTFFLCGKLGWGRIMLLFPAPVTNGFLGSVGVLAVRGSLQMASGVPFYVKTTDSFLPSFGDTFMWPSNWSAFMAPDAISQVGAMLVMVLFVRSAPKWCKKHLQVRAFEHLWDFLCLLATLALFYVIVLAAGIDFSALRSSHPRWVLLWESGERNVYQPFTALWRTYDFERVDVNIVMQRFHTTLTVSLLSLVSLVLNLSEIQQQFPDEYSGSSLDVNHELAGQGVVNVVLGCSGGHIAFTNCPGTFMNRAMGGTHRLSCFVAAGVVATVFLSGSPFSHFIPNFFSGGMLMIIGISFLEVIANAYQKLPRKEFAVTAGEVVIALFSVEYAVAAGLAVVVFQFMFNAANASPVRDTRHGAVCFSCTKRPAWERSVLLQHGRRIVLVELEGFLFFGTAVRMSDALMRILNDDVEHILLDFARVSSLDSTAAEALASLKMAADDARCQLFCCNLREQMERMLRCSGVLDETGCSPSLRSAHETCEDHVLDKYFYSQLGKDAREPQRSQLTYHAALQNGGEMPDEAFCLLLGSAGFVSKLRAWSQVKRVECGESIFCPQDQSSHLVFIRAGVVDLVVPKLDESGDLISDASSDVRIRHPAGNAVGKAEFLRGTPHTCRAVVSSPNGALVWVLGAEAWEEIKMSDVDLRIELMDFLLRDMAEDAGTATGALPVTAAILNAKQKRDGKPSSPPKPVSKRVHVSSPTTEPALSPDKLEALVPAPLASREIVVDVWNEWDPLEEIIVGIADGSSVPPMEDAHHAKVWDRPAIIESAGSMRSAEKVKAANAQLDNLARVLEGRGITVRRPNVCENGPVDMLSWRSEIMNGWTCPRDTLLSAGTEIIEAPVSWRSRLFESHAYREILSDYFKRDAGMLWTAAPRPRLADDLYRPMRHVSPERRRNMSADRMFVTMDDVEPVFDAADCLKFGRDIFCLHGNTTNEVGITWLKQHLQPRGFRVHVLNFPQVTNPSHLDGYIMPLREGLLLAHPLVSKGPELDVFRRNGWQVVEVAPPCGPPLSKLAKSSEYIHINVISIDPQTVVVDEAEAHLVNQLEGLGFQVVGIPFREVIEFGGGIHCATLDVRRRGQRACSYFPEFD